MNTSTLADYPYALSRVGEDTAILLPEQELLTDENCRFSFHYRWDGSNTKEYALILECEFSAEEYDSEIARLKATATEYSDCLFQKPAYILYLDFVNSYEYALIDDEGLKIQYVMHQLFEPGNADWVPDEYRLRPEYAGERILPYGQTYWPTQPSPSA